jgi:cyclic pyranopterin phosphate synthase
MKKIRRDEQTRLTHFDRKGRAAMVDISAKPATERVATAKASVKMARSTLAMVKAGKAAKGDVLGVARLGGIMAAKRTHELIPLCHPLPLAQVAIDLVCDSRRSKIDITATCRLQGQTGVEMEALTAAAVAALTIYDMCKAVERGMRITDLRLVYKSGGKSGTYRASDRRKHG